MNEYMTIFRHRVKIIVSTKQKLAEERINEELEKLEQEGYLISDVECNISYAGKEGYQIIGVIKYAEEINNELNKLEDIDVPMRDLGIDFGSDMPTSGQ